MSIEKVSATDPVYEEIDARKGDSHAILAAESIDKEKE